MLASHWLVSLARQVTSLALLPFPESSLLIKYLPAWHSGSGLNYVLSANGKWCILGCRKLTNGLQALWVIAEISGDDTLEALKFIHTSPFSVRTATIASPLSGDYGEEKNPKQTTIPNH